MTIIGDLYSTVTDDDDAVAFSVFAVQLTPVARTPSWSYRISFTVASTTETLNGNQKGSVSYFRLQKENNHRTHTTAPHCFMFCLPLKENRYFGVRDAAALSF